MKNLKLLDATNRMIVDNFGDPLIEEFKFAVGQPGFFCNKEHQVTTSDIVSVMPKGCDRIIVSTQNSSYVFGI